MLAIAAAVLVCSGIFLLPVEEENDPLKIYSRSSKVFVLDSVRLFIICFRGILSKESLQDEERSDQREQHSYSDHEHPGSGRSLQN
jgi:hypothetical protein